MAKHFRIEVMKDGQAWCVVEMEHPSAERALRDVLRRFPESEGYQASVRVAVDERRILETGPGGRLRLLAREPLFQAWEDAGRQ